MLQFYEFEEFILHAYENVKLNKEKMKSWHDKHNVPHLFNPVQRVLMFISKSKLFLDKQKSKWYGLFKVVRMNSLGAIELIDKEKGKTFLVNGQVLDTTQAIKKTDRGVHCNFITRDYELGHAAILDQALHERQPMNIM